MSEYSGYDDPTPSGGATGNLNALMHPPATGPAPMQDLGSILLDPTQHFRLDLDQAPQAIATFRQAAQQMRDLKREALRLAEVTPPGLDAVSINAAKEIGSGRPARIRVRCVGRWNRARFSWRRQRKRWSSHSLPTVTPTKSTPLT
ncbi:MAG: hypothetical protein M3Y48_18915 [Actinomycetota bacterium]|nr:hypothetical protein [Actinomycetota bacterium]